MKEKTKNRILSLLMAMVLLAGVVFPSAASAEGIAIVEDKNPSAESSTVYSTDPDAILASDGETAQSDAEEESGGTQNAEQTGNIPTADDPSNAAASTEEKSTDVEVKPDVSEQDLNDDVIESDEVLNVTAVNPLEGGGETVTVEASEEPQIVSHGFMLFAASPLSSPSYSEDKSALAATFRQEMVNRSETIDLYYQAPANYNDKNTLINLAYEFFNQAVTHTSKGNEGDYLNWNYHTWTASISYKSDTSTATYLHYEYEIEYYTTAEQEAEVTSKVQALISELGLSSMTNDYHKVVALYDWICSNVKYDHTNVSNTSYYRQYTAYAALAYKTCVCQGYANLMYRVLCEVGVPVRFVGSQRQRHAWNIVQLDGSWYELDSTWDSELTTASAVSYQYFLKGSDFKTSHYGGDTDSEVASAGYTLHTWGAATTTTATCTKEGITTRTCSNCSEVQKTTTPALGHVWELTSETTATCTKAGEAKYKCSRCGEAKTETVDALGHDWVETITKAATCTETGTKTYECSRCHETKAAETIPALGHQFAIAPYSTTATCTKAGTAVYPCTREGCVVTETKDVAALGHDWTVTTTEATCTEAGTKTSTCSRCSETQTETTAAALGHDPVAIAETTTTVGGTKCSRCGITLTEPSTKVTVSGLDATAGQTVYLDGVAYTMEESGKLPASLRNSTTAVTYSYNKSSNDPHEVYPTGMKVWLLTKDASGNVTATRAESLDNLLTYSGTAIRISGNQGIRIKTTMQKSTRNTLINSGLYGYQVKEYGTIVSWASANSNPTYGGSGVMTGQAYVRGSRDSIISETDSTVTYANVLTFTDMAKTKPDLAIRPYIVLTNGTNQIILYGGVLIRSIYSVATQLQTSFAQGTSGYDFVQNIISYGKNN